MRVNDAIANFSFDPNCSIESVSCECKNLKSGRADDRSERGLFFLGAVKGAVFLGEHQWPESRNILSSRGTFWAAG